jgi:MFS family permease
MIEKRGKRDVYLLGSSSFFNDIGSEMITPIVPFFINSLGGSGVSIGLVSGLREGLSSLLKLFGGWFSDRLGKRIGIVFFGYVFSAIMKILISLAQTSTQLISAVSFERIGKMRDAPRDAIISKIAKTRGHNFGINEMMDKLGGMIGTILVLLLLYFMHADFRTIVLIAAGISLLSIIPLFFVRDSETPKLKENFFKSIFSLDKQLRKTILMIALFSLANFGLYMFFLLRTQEITGSTTIPLVLYVFFNLIIAIFSKPMGKYSDRVGRRNVIFFGYILFSVVCLGFAYATSLTIVAALFCLYGLVIAMTEPVQRALIGDLSDGSRGTAMGLYHFSIGIATILGGLIAGYLWDVNRFVMFYYLAAVAIIAAIIFITKMNYVKNGR